MAVPVVPSFETNAIVPSSSLAALAQAVAYALRPPACLARRAAAQSIPTGVTTAVLLDTEHVDNTAGMFAPTSATITIGDPGVYSVSAGGIWAIAAAGDRVCMIYVNGSEIDGGGASAPGSAANLIRQSASQKVLLSAGDTVEMRVFQSSGGAVNFTGRLSVVRSSGI